MDWFDKKRAIAFVMPETGWNIGTFAWPLVTTFLVSVYAWRGAILIIGGIQLHGLVFSALVRSPKPRATKEVSGISR